MHKRHYNMMCDAANFADKSNMLHKHGAIVTDKKGSKISAGYNKCVYLSGKNSHTHYMSGKKMTIHAEEMALKNADPRKLKGAILYVVRSRDGMLNSMPCERCMSIIGFCMKKHGLKMVYYSA
jgi:cytidine deaminase